LKEFLWAIELCNPPSLKLTVKTEWMGDAAKVTSSEKFCGCEPPSEVTQLSQACRDGDRKALDILLSRVDKELCRVARHQLRNE
jgi:hypothetical protein